MSRHDGSTGCSLFVANFDFNPNCRFLDLIQNLIILGSHPRLWSPCMPHPRAGLFKGEVNNIACTFQ